VSLSQSPALIQPTGPRLSPLFSARQVSRSFRTDDAGPKPLSGPPPGDPTRRKRAAMRGHSDQDAFSELALRALAQGSTGETAPTAGPAMRVTNRFVYGRLGGAHPRVRSTTVPQLALVYRGGVNCVNDAGA
jgi:hypothetical protein